MLSKRGVLQKPLTVCWLNIMQENKKQQIKTASSSLATCLEAYIHLPKGQIAIQCCPFETFIFLWTKSRNQKVTDSPFHTTWLKCPVPDTKVARWKSYFWISSYQDLTILTHPNKHNWHSSLCRFIWNPSYEESPFGSLPSPRGDGLQFAKFCKKPW